MTFTASLFPVPDDFITMNLFKIKGMLGVAHDRPRINNSLLTREEDGHKY